MDPIYRTLNSLSQHGETPDHQILQNLIKWKSVFSKKWFDKHYDSQPVQYLKSIWKMLFVFVEYEDPTISVAAFNDIGALLIALSPFYSDDLIESFGEIVVDLNVTPNTSIAVISTFVYLSHFVGPHRNTNFFESICVLHFFSADLHNFIQYVPQLIKQMSQMNFEFHQRLMRSLLTSFGRNPNSQFVDSIICLMERFPRRLMNELSQFLETNNLSKTLFAIGSKLLETKSLSSFISVKQMRIMLDESKRVFEDLSNASSLEHAVGILSNLANISSPVQEEVINYIDDICSRDFPPHIKRNLLPLSRKIEYVIPCETDSSNVLAAKVSALGNFGPEHDIEIIHILQQLVHRKDDVFTSVAEYLSSHLCQYMKNASKNDELKEPIKEIINTIIEYTDRNWVQQVAIAMFIGSNNQFECIRFVPDYIDKCIRFLILTCISPQESLAEEARKAAVSFVGLHNIHEFLTSLITQIDFFNENTPYRVILLLNELYKTIPTQFYNNFIPIFHELIRDNNSKSLTSEFLFFLSNMRMQNITQSYESICLNLMQQYYFSFTGITLLQSNSSDVKQTPSFLQNVATDIVANSSLNYSDLLEPLHKCFQFLIATQHPQIHLVIHLLPLFPYEALKYLYTLKIPSHQVESLIPIVIRIFHQSQDMNVTGLCVKFLIRYSKESLKPILHYLINMIHSKQVQIATVGQIFLKAIRMINDNWNNYAFCLLSDLPLLEKNLFALKLVKIADPQFLEALKIQFPFISIDTDTKSCLKWLKTNSLRYWPINDHVFSMKLATYIDKAKPKFVLDTYVMDNEHWIFLLNNSQYFNIQILKNRQNHIKTHFNTDIHNLNSSYTFHSIITNNPYPKIATLAPILKRKGTYIKSAPLLASFLNFSNIKISEELVDQMTSEKFADEKVLNASIEYKKRFGYYVSDFDQKVNVQNILKSTPKAKDIRKFCIYTDSYTPIAHLNSIASLFSADIEKLSKPKKMFYFIRFLRIVLSMKLSNYQMIVSMALYNLDRIIQVIDHPEYGFSDYLLKEISMLLFNNIEWKNQNEIASKYPIFEPFLSTTSQHLQFLIEFKPPSYQLHAIRACNQNDLLDPIPYFIPCIQAPLLTPLFDVEYALYLATHFHYLSNNETLSQNSQKNEETKSKADSILILIQTLLNPRLPAFDDCYNLLIILLTLPNINYQSLMPFFDISYKEYYMLKTLIDLTVVFYENIIPDSNKAQPIKLKTRSRSRNSLVSSNSTPAIPPLDDDLLLKQADTNPQKKLIYNIVTAEIKNSLVTFLKNQTVQNAKSMAGCLLKHSGHYLISSPLISMSGNRINRFYMSYLSIYLTLQKSPAKVKQIFSTRVNELKQKFQPKSHVRALELLLEDKFEEGFLFATVETNNLNAVDSIYGFSKELNQVNEQHGEIEIDQNDRHGENELEENDQQGEIEIDQDDRHGEIDIDENQVDVRIDATEEEEYKSHEEEKIEFPNLNDSGPISPKIIENLNEFDQTSENHEESQFEEESINNDEIIED